MRRVLLAAGVTLCMAALAIGGLGAAQFRLSFASGPLLVDPHGLAVDEAGRIYVGVAGIQLHVYAPDGKLLNAWSVAGDGQPLRLELQPGAITAATPERVFVFGRDGALRATHSDGRTYERIGPARDRSVDAGATHYRLEGMSLVRERPEPVKVLVAEPPWPLRVSPNQPLVFALLLAGGVGGLLVLPILVGRARRGPGPADG